MSGIYLILGIIIGLMGENVLLGVAIGMMFEASFDD